MLSTLFVSTDGLGPDVDILRNGWILRRSEEMAILMCIEKLTRVGADLCRAAQLAQEGGQTRGNAPLNSRCGQALRVCDQAQLIILNALRNKNRCQA